MPITKKAFTLAEVLITLGIIGVVAMMTIPTLVSDYHKSIVETKTKEVYSILNQALISSVSVNGSPDTWDSLNAVFDPDQFLQTYLLPFIKTSNVSSTPGMIYDFAGNTVGTYPTTGYYSKLYYLMNGTAIVFIQGGGTGRGKGFFYLLLEPNNSSKILGKNVFAFNLIVDGGFYLITSTQSYPTPAGFAHVITWAKLISYCNDINNDSYGMGAVIGCTTLLEMNGWKIPDDYPIKF